MQPSEYSHQLPFVRVCRGVVRHVAVFLSSGSTAMGHMPFSSDVIGESVALGTLYLILYLNSGTIRLGLHLKRGTLWYILCLKSGTLLFVLFLRVEPLKHLLLPPNSCGEVKCAFVLSHLRTLSLSFHLSLSHLLNYVLLLISSACSCLTTRHLGHLLKLYYCYGQFAFCLDTF